MRCSQSSKLPTKILSVDYLLDGTCLANKSPRMFLYLELTCCSMRHDRLENNRIRHVHREAADLSARAENGYHGA